VHDLLIPFISVIGGLALLTIGGELLLRGGVALARQLGVSPMLIGLTVVACATSMPELVVTVTAGLGGKPMLGIGNVIGSNIANILLILGVTGLIATIRPPPSLALREGAVMLGATVIFLVLTAIDALRWFDGVLLVVLLGLYLFSSYRSDRHRGDAALDPEAKEALEHASKSSRIAFTLVLFGASGLVLGSELLVDGSVVIARGVGVSDAVIGLTLVAIGTSLPELAASIVAALRKHPDVALGNVIGSNIFNLLGIGGVLGMVIPVELSPELLAFDVWVMLAATLILFGLLCGRVAIGRFIGLLLCLLYLGFILMQFQGKASAGLALLGG
jgi:cation:H+ antiporter